MGLVVRFPNHFDSLGAVTAARHTAERAEQALGDALHAVYTLGTWNALGYPSFDAYARAEAGIGRRRAWTLMRQAESRRLLRPDPALAAFA